MLDYKKKEREKEVEKLNKDIELIKKKKIEVDEVNNIKIQKVPLTNKVIISEDDFTNISTAAKKYITQDKKERRLNKMLKSAENTIVELKETIDKHAKELFSFKPLKGKHKLC